MVPAAVEGPGGLDVLVNNAGISGPTAPVEGVDSLAWDTVLNVNLTGSFHVTRLAIPHLKQSGAGSIIIMSSLGGRFGYLNRSPVLRVQVGPRRVRQDAGDRVRR